MYKNIVTQTLRRPLLNAAGISADVLRADKIHRDISGNKWFKLKYHLKEAIERGKQGIVTFGGAYSNHLVATAVAAREHRLRSTGIVRGEETFPENESVKQMKDAGMQLIYVSREEYRNKNEIIQRFMAANEHYYYIPEGGQSPEGIRGAGEMLNDAKSDYTHIICPVGTGTTMAGVINASGNHQNVIGVSALKINDRVTNELSDFIKTNANKQRWILQYDYHFGGYAKKTGDLIAYMNAFYMEEKIPTDFVYTAKMFFAVDDLARRGYFPRGSTLLLIHTGGLQGNRSLPEGTLVF